ncbi:MAG: SHOCT domain-containing protein [Eubacteriaceae bacterium]
MMLIGWVLIGVVIYYVLKNDRGLTFSSKSSAEELLKERYVNGEIDEETYLKMKNVLKK